MLLLALRGRALAETAPSARVRLSYLRDETAPGCPDAERLRTGVASRLGYDPFVDEAPRVVEAQVTRAGAALKGSIRLRDARGTVTAERMLSSTHDDCIELESALELAISIAIDPLAGARAASEKEGAAPSIPPAPAAISEPPRAPTTAPPAEGPVRTSTEKSSWFVDAAGLVSFGTAPSAQPGVALEAGLRRGRASVRLGAEIALPVTNDLDRGQMRATLVRGELVPCVHVSVLAGCVLASAGVFRAEGVDLADAQTVTDPYVAVGGRLQIDLPLGAGVFALARADLAAPLTRTRLRVSGDTVWTTPPVAGGAAIGLGTSL